MGLLHKGLFFISVLIFNQSCNNVAKVKHQNVCEEELLKLIDSLENNKVSLIKYLVKDQKADTLKIDQPNWKNELYFFSNIMLSKNSLNNYSKREYQRNNYEYLEYLAKDNGSIKSVKIKKHKGSVILYQIDYAISNRLSEITYHLAIDFKKGYLIESNQSIPYSYQTHFKAEGNFK